MVYGGVTVGMYQPVRNWLSGNDATPALYNKVMAGALTGGVGSGLASPCDLVKVRLMADSTLERPRYRGSLHAFIEIPRTEGVATLFRGVQPTVVRAMAINGTGIPAYDHTKYMLMQHTSLGDRLPTHVLSSALSGFLSASVSVPMDVVKTRIMNQHAGKKMYKGVVDCAVRTFKSEGVSAFYKGFLPAYMRLAPWQLIFFVTYERVSVLLTGKSFQTGG